MISEYNGSLDRRTVTAERIGVLMSLSADQLLQDDTFKNLGRRILAGECVLFVGAGASLSSGAPNTELLAGHLASSLLNTQMSDASLIEVIEAADAIRGRRSVTKAIREKLENLTPSQQLRDLVSLDWISIYSVNFDDLIEKAAELIEKPLQVFRSATNLDSPMLGRTPLYMLHGSVRDPDDKKMGLVITNEDQFRAKAQRTALYRRLADDMQSHEIVYVGFSMGDVDFRSVISDLREAIGPQTEQLARGYKLSPDPPPFSKEIWDQRKISIIDSSLEEFVKALKVLRSGSGSIQPIGIGETPALPKFLATVSPDSVLGHQFDWAFEFPQTERGVPDPETFLDGGPASWATIEKRFDASRDVADRLTEAILVSDIDEPGSPGKSMTPFVLVSGPAGTGKSTLMKRIAWDLANTWGQAVAWARRPARMDLGLIELLANRAGRRVYLFVDNAADVGDHLVRIIKRCRTQGIPISFVLSDRINEWDASTISNPLEPTYHQRLMTISRSEAERVIEVLRKANRLGYLANLSHDAAVERLLARSGNHLLVAMKEATENERFDRIVKDEYENIPSTLGRSAYRYVCTLFQFGIPIRAGMLSRLTGVRIADIPEKILVPTNRVILDNRTLGVQPVYRARHEVIAQIVFRMAHTSSEARANAIVDILEQLDTGYRDDDAAFYRLISARWLEEIGLRVGEMNRVYEAAELIRPKDAPTVHQRALSLRGTDRSAARELLRVAQGYDSQNDHIRHSEIVLLVDEAWEQRQPESRDEMLDRAIEELERSRKLDRTNPAPYVTQAGLLLKLAEQPDKQSQRIELVSEAEGICDDASKFCQMTPQLLDMLGRVQEASGDLPEAEESYRGAATASRRNPYFWIGYARFLQRQGDVERAVDVLNEGLDELPAHPTVSYKLAKVAQLVAKPDDALIRMAFQTAINEPVRSHLPELDFAIYLHMAGRIEEADEIFRRLRNSQLPYVIKSRPRAWLKDSSGKITYDAEVARVLATTVRVTVNGVGSDLYLQALDNQGKLWSVGSKLKVHVFYNCFGLNAAEVH